LLCVAFLNRVLVDKYRRDQPHNFCFLIVGLLVKLKYAVRT